MKLEAIILAECLMELSKAGHMVFRNNTGGLQDKNGRYVKFGLCVGSSDIIGLCKDGKFLAVETKTAKGKASKEQLGFIAAVQAKGGRAGIARSALEAVNIARG